jgi:hypothetical protein
VFRVAASGVSGTGCLIVSNGQCGRDTSAGRTVFLFPRGLRADQHSHETPYADDMLFWECVRGEGFYYAGQVGGSSRFETSSPASATISNDELPLRSRLAMRSTPGQAGASRRLLVAWRAVQ